MDNYLRKLNDKYLFIPKAIYLIVNLQFYGFHALRPVFAKEKFGISTEDYGKNTGYTQFITFFTSILIGNITDRTKKYQASFLTLISLSTLVFLMFYVNSLNEISPSIFWICLLFYLVFNNPKQPLLDKIMIEYLDKSTEYGSKVYGKQRLWGTFALPAATYISEWLTSLGDGKYNFDNLIYYNIIATLAAISCVVFFFKPSSTSQDQTNHDVKENTKNNIQDARAPRGSRRGTFIELLTNFEFMFFFLIIFMNAISRSALTIYLTLFHREVLNISPKEVPESWPSVSRVVLSNLFDKPLSTLATTGVVFEIGSLFLADKIIGTFGYFLPLLMAQAVSLIRFLAYYFIPANSPYAFELSCVVELLRGIYFGMIHISSVYIATKMAPPHLRTTSQMIYQGTFGALGFLVSGQVFGSMFKSKLAMDLNFEEKDRTYRQIFLINIIFGLITIGICTIKYGLIDRVLFNKENERKKLSKYDEQPVTIEGVK